MSPPPPRLTAQIDHLVVVADSLDQGVQWCEATLGITPGPGGQHALMGTHNRLFKIASYQHPQTYFEIIAINPDAPAPGRRRWFDMDDDARRERISRQGPELAHFVASVSDVDAAVAALNLMGIDRGKVLPASRSTPAGLLQWQITVRDDGQRLLDGCLPTLIQWSGAHPTRAMADSGIALQTLQLSHPQAATLAAACRAIGLDAVSIQPGPAGLAATLQTPRGLVSIHA